VLVVWSADAYFGSMHLALLGFADGSLLALALKLPIFGRGPCWFALSMALICDSPRETGRQSWARIRVGVLAHGACWPSVLFAVSRYLPTLVRFDSSA